MPQHYGARSDQEVSWASLMTANDPL